MQTGGAGLSGPNNDKVKFRLGRHSRNLSYWIAGAHFDYRGNILLAKRSALLVQRFLKRRLIFGTFRHAEHHNLRRERSRERRAEANRILSGRHSIAADEDLHI